MAGELPPPRRSKLGLLLRAGIFAFLAVASLFLFGTLMTPVAGYVAASVLSTFAAAAIANAVALRIYERGRLADIGLGWNAASSRNLALGLSGGLGAALLVLGLPLLFRLAEFRRDPAVEPTWGGMLFLTILLLFGAIGEEMLFRGYGFQVFVVTTGRYAAILPTSVLFAAAHSSNENVVPLGLLNTFLWGVLLCLAFLRSGDLWLPIGLHYGWNVALPFFGVNLSGFRMGVTGYALQWKTGALWSGGDYGPEGGLLTTLVLVALFYFLAKAPIERQEAFLLRGSGEE